MQFVTGRSRTADGPAVYLSDERLHGCASSAGAWMWPWWRGCPRRPSARGSGLSTPSARAEGRFLPLLDATAIPRSDHGLSEKKWRSRPFALRALRLAAGTRGDALDALCARRRSECRMRTWQTIPRYSRRGRCVPICSKYAPQSAHARAVRLVRHACRCTLRETMETTLVDRGVEWSDIVRDKRHCHIVARSTTSGSSARRRRCRPGAARSDRRCHS